MNPYAHVVVGSDGSASAQSAVHHAAQLASAVGARLTVVTACAPEGPTHRADEARARADAGRRLAMDLGVSDVRVEVGIGDPATFLIDSAERLDADVLVVGSKGMTSPSRFLLGSVPDKVSHHCPCDLVIVRTAD